MRYKNLIRFKALFLLLVFSLNTVVGFACAMGVGMGFNTTHHDDDDEAIEVQAHDSGKIHQHHHEANEHHHDKQGGSKKDDCCNDKVIKFQNLDKSLNQNSNTAIEAPVFIAIISTFLSDDFLKILKAYPPKYRVRFFYPPPPDIRIAIQSFQI